MEGWEKNNFENSWKDAFEGAEVSPSESVWTDIEQKLDHSAMKKRVIFYQRLAAACVLFALVTGSFGFYYWNENNKQLANGAQIKNNWSDELKHNVSDSAQQNRDNELTVLNKSDGKKNDEVSKVSSEKGKPNQKQIVESTISKIENESQSAISNANKKQSLSERKNNSSDKTLTAKTQQAQQGESISQPTIVADKSLLVTRQEKNIPSNHFNQSLNNDDVDEKSSLSQKEKFSSNENQNLISQSSQEKESTNRKFFTADLSIPEPGLLPIDSVKSELVYVELAHKLPVVSAAFLDIDKIQKPEYEKVWVALAASTGNYAANSSGSSYYAPSTLSGSYSATAANTSKGSTYAVGVLGGVRLANRWVLQSGLQYINQSSGYTSTINATSLYAVANSAQYSLSATPISPYKIISTNEFISLPVQAGYLLLNGKLGVQINSGVASNFFVRNTLSDPSGQRKSYSQGPGENSAYRSVNFTGLLGSELSYRFRKNYRLSFVPGIGYSLSSIMKNQTVNNPLSWDVGLRFRYIFR